MLYLGICILVLLFVIFAIWAEEDKKTMHEFFIIKRKIKLAQQEML